MFKPAAAILALFLSVAAHATEIIENQYAFSEVSIQEGQLHSSNIKSIISDEKYVWFGTTSGIDRHSCSEHKFWEYPIKTKNSMTEDSSGCVWLVNENGAFIFDKSIDDFTDAQVYTTPDSRCRAIGDEVWVLAGNRATVFHSGSANRVREVEFEKGISVMDISSLPDGNILLATMSGLMSLDPQGGAVKPFSAEASPNPRVIKLIGDRIYACNYGYGVWIYDTDGTFLGKIEGVPSDYVTDIALFEDRLWISTDGAGITLYDPETSETSIIWNIPGDDTSFPTNAVSVLCPDMSGGLWAGSVRYGAFNFHKRYIKTYSNSYPGMSYGLSEKCTVQLFQTEDNTCWIGTDGQGINKFSPETGRFTHFPSTFGHPVPSLCNYDDRGRILASFFNAGLFLFDPSTSALQKFPLGSDLKDEDLFRDGTYPLLFKARKDRLFILGSDMFVLNPLNGSLVSLSADDGTTYFGTGTAWYSEDFILVTIDGKLYINRYDDFVLHVMASIGDDGVYSAITYDKVHNRIWASINSTNLGFYQLIGNGTVSEYHTVGSIDLSGITTLTADSKGRLWITALGQLYLYEHETGRFKLFSKYDGYEWNDIISTSNTEVKDNIFYLAGTSGFVSVNTDIADDPAKAGSPAVSISEVITSQKRYTFSNDRNKKKYLKIPAGYKSLDINFSVSGLNIFERVLMKYTISGATENTATTSDLSLHLSSLAPGKYTITATCQGSSPVSLKGETLNLKIATRWYNSVWFLCLICAILIAALCALYMLMSRGNPAQNEISQKDRDFLRRFCEYVSLNIDKELSAETLTKELGISRTLLFEKVKMLTGKTVSEYIKHLRIERATTLLKDTNMSVNEISDAVGFSYPRYFSSVFKEVTGMSPSQFKKSL